MMPISTPDQLALAKRVHTRLIKRPEQHNQEIFYSEGECGTQACTAGWTAVLNGAQLKIEGRPGYRATTKVVLESGEERNIWWYARTALGLSSDEACGLFGAGTTESDAVTYLGELIADGETRLSGASA